MTSVTLWGLTRVSCAAMIAPMNTHYAAFYALKVPRKFAEQHCILEDEARDNAATTERASDLKLIGNKPHDAEYQEQFVATVSVQLALSDRYTEAFKKWLVKHTGITY